MELITSLENKEEVIAFLSYMFGNSREYFKHEMEQSKRMAEIFAKHSKSEDINEAYSFYKRSGTYRFSHELKEKFDFSLSDLEDSLFDEIIEGYLSKNYDKIGKDLYAKLGENNLGSFENESGSFIISDPCYEIGTWCAGRLDNVATGQWNAFVTRVDGDDWGVRCSEISAYHVSVIDKNLDWVKSDIHVGVDSGQAGIFDVPKFHSKNEEWYSQICDLTSSDLGAETLDGGVVSSSGYGDGGYDCYYTKKDDKIVAVKICFIEEYNEEYDEEEDEEND